MKKALIIATVGGFLQKFEMNNVRLLQEAGYEVHYVSNLNNPIYHLDKQELEANGIKLHQVDISKNPFRIWQLYRNICAVYRLADAEKINLIHCHTPVGGVIGRLVGRRIKGKSDEAVKVIYTAHGFHFYKGAPLLNWMIYYPVERWLSRYTDCLITINTEDFQCSKKMHAKYIKKIPSVGLDMVKYFPKDNKQRKKSTPYQVVSVGELNANKNYEVVIEAIAKLRDLNIQYCIYGDGPYRDRLQKKINQLGVQNIVFLKGYSDEINLILNESDCFVLASKREGLGMAALEAMACGVPVIAADNRGTREYILHEKTGLSCRNNIPFEYEENIRRLYNDLALSEQIALSGREKAKQFEQEKTKGIMKQIYEGI